MPGSFGFITQFPITEGLYLDFVLYLDTILDLSVPQLACPRDKSPCGSLHDSLCFRYREGGIRASGGAACILVVQKIAE